MVPIPASEKVPIVSPLLETETFGGLELVPPEFHRAEISEGPLQPHVRLMVSLPDGCLTEAGTH